MQVILMLAIAFAWQSAADDRTARELAVQLATRSLSSRLAVDVQAIRLVSAEPVDWPDSSLGCPAGGMVYMPAIVPGFRVRLESGGTTYELHTGGGRVVDCDGQTGAPAPPATRSDAPALLAADRARRQLASTLEVPASSFTVKTVRPWRATDGACERPSQAKAPETSTRTESTFLVELTRGAETWRYRATTLRAWKCETPSGV
jgi:hypothetical protein